MLQQFKLFIFNHKQTTIQIIKSKSDNDLSYVYQFKPDYTNHKFHFISDGRIRHSKKVISLDKYIEAIIQHFSDQKKKSTSNLFNKS